MRRRFVGFVVAGIAALGLFGVAPSAEAAPPGPQCVLPCDGPVQKLLRICQYAYCQFP